MPYIILEVWFRLGGIKEGNVRVTNLRGKDKSFQSKRNCVFFLYLSLTKFRAFLLKTYKIMF